MADMLKVHPFMYKRAGGGWFVGVVGLAPSKDVPGRVCRDNGGRPSQSLAASLDTALGQTGLHGQSIFASVVMARLSNSPN